MIRRVRTALSWLLVALPLAVRAAEAPAVPDTVIESQACEITSSDTQTLSVPSPSVRCTHVR